MKVIFLDIDGVLNFDGTEAKAPSGCDGLVDRLVKKLKVIIDNTNALVVLSSDWRHDWYKGVEDLDDLPDDGRYLVKKLNRSGVHINSKTDDRYPDKYRGSAIIDWVNNHKGIDSWVVLDDVCFEEYLLYSDIMDRIVLTNPKTGLTDEDVKRAIDILNKQN